VPEIAATARDLDALRTISLNPPDWTRDEILTLPGSTDGPWSRFLHDPNAAGIGTVRYPRTVAKDAAAAVQLAKRTLTALCNQRPAWLDRAHGKLDEAVCAAYGWPADIPNAQILERLLALNLQRASANTASSPPETEPPAIE
jgi:hypothetical protein